MSQQLAPVIALDDFRRRRSESRRACAAPAFPPVLLGWVWVWFVR